MKRGGEQEEKGRQIYLAMPQLVAQERIAENCENIIGKKRQKSGKYR